MSSTTVKHAERGAAWDRSVTVTRCGTCCLQLFYVYWSKMEMIIKYFASFGTVSHDFYTHIQKKNRSFAPKWNVTNYDIL